jgi:hypothetical protein
MGMTKRELMKFIDDAVDLEERAIQIYSKHLNTALFWSGFPELTRKQLSISLNMLIKESGRNSAELNALKEKIGKGGKDVY